MDIQLATTEQGAGFPLLLLHGNGESAAYFEHQFAFFAAHFRVIAPDTRGHGRTPRGAAPFTLAQFADDLAEFMRQRQIERAHILGFSDGGNIALLLALKYPQLVAKLVLNGANLEPAGVKTGVQLPIVAGYAAAALAAPFSRRARSQKEMLGLMVTQPHIAPAELSRLTCPTLVIAGTNDMIRDDHTRAIAAAIPGAELALLPGDHFIAAKNSAAFNQRVLEFLQK